MEADWSYLKSCKIERINQHVDLCTLPNGGYFSDLYRFLLSSEIFLNVNICF